METHNLIEDTQNDKSKNNKRSQYMATYVHNTNTRSYACEVLTAQHLF